MIAFPGSLPGIPHTSSYSYISIFCQIQYVTNHPEHLIIKLNKISLKTSTSSGILTSQAVDRKYQYVFQLSFTLKPCNQFLLKISADGGNHIYNSVQEIFRAP